MAGYDNIKDCGFDKMSAERQREIASMGGKASQEKRKRQKTLREMFAMVGNMPVTEKTLQNKIKAMGFEVDEITWNLAMVVSAYMTSIKKGDTKSVALILKMLDDVNESKKENKFDEFMNDGC